MVAARANWKGYLKFGEISCPVALYTGASTSERISFHTVNRDTGHRVRREFIDPVTEKPVEREDQIKGFEIDTDRYVEVEPDEIANAVPDSKKLLAVAAFIPCSEIDTVFFDKPYYLAPSGKIGEDAFAVIREALRASKVGALAHAVLFRRYRALMIRAQGLGLVAHTLNFDYEVRSAAEAFDEIPKLKIQKEMLELAKHIIETKKGEFDPSKFDDRYEAAVAEMVKAKLAGKPVKVMQKAKAPKVVDLMEALRASVGAGPAAAGKGRPVKSASGLKKAS
ncbi:non-homologous end joining protein Ku [Bosea rubneri]|uniref:Non-homologous end joining protein Ku n=1 Tax=Bosea rubneri TaxID=3075434 RepID=A0ABU3SGI7_9HYPH|nr:Ku protein [Bosea sp. ZW T0_25]MDU0343892.1 Ku protein [Bosea sp. ZW T0_25]